MIRPGAGAAIAGRLLFWTRASTNAYADAGRFSARSNSLMKSTTPIDERSAAPQPASSRTHGSRMQVVYRAMAFALAAVFLASVARFYHRDTGFTSLIGFPDDNDVEPPALRAVPHFTHPAWASYDGQFYAERALDPLVRDPAVDHAMDLAPYRARRILFSWTAYVLGLGRPAWILEAYALQNVASWLILAAVLTRWFPLRTPRALALWTACMFSHGLLWSVRFALLDGPSLVLLTAAILASERGRYFLSAVIAGVNGLGRETNVLGAAAQPFAGTGKPTSIRGWLRLGAALVAVVLPILMWEDYLRSIYRSTIFAASGDQLTVPATALAATAMRVVSTAGAQGLFSSAGLQVCLVLAMMVQGVYLAFRRRYDEPWWRVAAAYAVLMLLIDRVLWEPATGAITRVMLPMTVGFNVMLAREARGPVFWSWFVLGNLHVVPSFWVMPLV